MYNSHILICWLSANRCIHWVRPNINVKNLLKDNDTPWDHQRRFSWRPTFFWNKNHVMCELGHILEYFYLKLFVNSLFHWEEMSEKHVNTTHKLNWKTLLDFQSESAGSNEIGKDNRSSQMYFWRKVLVSVKFIWWRRTIE